MTGCLYNLIYRWQKHFERQMRNWLSKSKSYNLQLIVYKKTDEWYIEWQWLTTSGTTSDNKWQRVTTNDIEWYNEWQRVIQRVAMNGNKWQRVVQRMTTSGTTSDNEWYNEWQRVTISANFYFFQIRKEPSTKHPKENSLNIEEDLWRRPIELRTEATP